MKKWSMGILMMLGALNGVAQSSGLYYLDKKYDDDPMDDVTHLDLGMNILTNNVYLGRRDKSSLPYITPYIGYYFRSGFYLNGSVSYGAQKKFGRFDMACLEGGYDRTYGTTILAGVYAQQYFYYKRSTAITAAISQSAGIYVKYMNDLIEPQVNFTYNNTTLSPDYVIQISLDHHFQLAQKKLNIYPTFSFYTGTQHFYDNYYVNRIKRESNVDVSSTIPDAGNIRPVAAEFSVKTILWTGHWMFIFTPTYAVPMGYGKVILPSGTVSEKLKGSFFVELDACFRRPREEMIRY